MEAKHYNSQYVFNTIIEDICKDLELRCKFLKEDNTSLVEYLETHIGYEYYSTTLEQRFIIWKGDHDEFIFVEKIPLK